MYRIMIVEDEPPITRYIKGITQSITKGFEVAGTAENGAEALDILAMVKPDVILTDVKMPVMDGIELVKRLKAKYPEIYTIIISGYQDFEYVKEAMKYGALDYLLKPVEPEQLGKLLDMLSLKLNDDYNIAGTELISRLMSNLPIDTGRLNKYLNYRNFSMMIVRRGSLPVRSLYDPLDNEEADFFSNLKEQPLEEMLDVDKVCLISGRDAYEIILVIGSSNDRCVNLKKASELVLSLVSRDKCFYTVVYSSKHFNATSFGENMGRVYNTLNQQIIIGKSQVYSDNIDLYHEMDQDPPVLSDSMENKLAFFISCRAKEHLKNELVRMFDSWEKQSRTQVWVEKMLRQVLGVVERHSSKFSAGISLNLERQLEEAVFYSTDFGSMLRCVWDIVEDMVCNNNTTCQNDKNEPRNFLGRVEAYIENNLSQAVTLQGICDIMGVSQTYMSRLFRKHKAMSFNEYVTDKRIKEAKRLMTEYPEMLLKDVACIVGYKDPYYFSRIFKTVTGSAPSAYIG